MEIAKIANTASRQQKEEFLQKNDWRDTPLGWVHQDLDGEYWSLNDVYEYTLEWQQ